MPEMQGAADLLLMADVVTFRILPWAPDTGWFLCDAKFHDGRAVPYCTRTLLRNALPKLAAQGFDFVAGLEVEFHVFRIVDEHLEPADAGQPGTPPGSRASHHRLSIPHRAALRHGRPGGRVSAQGPREAGLPLRSYEVEFGPSQLEFTLGAMPGMASADAMILFRSAVKQIAGAGTVITPRSCAGRSCPT